MKRAASLLWLAAKAHWRIALLPILFAYGVLPAAGLAARSETQATVSVSFAAQLLLPFGAVLWGMSYLQIWIDSAGEEAMLACSKGRTRVVELLLLSLFFLSPVFPAYLMLAARFALPFTEYLRLTIQTLILIGLLYGGSAAAHSASLGGMLPIGWLLFSALFTRDESLAAFCIIKPGIVSQAPELQGYAPFAGIAVIGWGIGWIMERIIKK